MKYKESRQIFKEIKGAGKIVINCHRGPDPDSVGSALALYQVLQSLDKEVEVICPDNLLDSYRFLRFSEKVKRINFEKFDFSSFDLFIVLDSADWGMVTGNISISQPDIKTIVIDHHRTNRGFGKINLIDSKASSTAEVLYLLFEDWEVKITEDIASALLAGIIGDTGVFQFPGASVRTLAIAKDLMEKGADKNEIIFNIYNSLDFNLIKFWGEILLRMEKDEKERFVWSAIPLKVYDEFSRPESAKETAATMFSRVVKDTDFGMIIIEKKEKTTAVSLRSRTDFDVSKIAVALGGGGHKLAAAAEIEGLKFDKAVDKILKTARKIIDEG
ncbi:MAG: bifunctional oligoribonuclease/PAP phosphatase NrnA [Microgenomates group bacterium]